MSKSWFQRLVDELVLMGLWWLQQVALELQPVLGEGGTPLQKVKDSKIENNGQRSDKHFRYRQFRSSQGHRNDEKAYNIFLIGER